MNSGWFVFQTDIKNAFLYGDLSAEVYMQQSPGYVAQGEWSKVCRLSKDISGLSR